jgi:hypothetical protein
VNAEKSKLVVERDQWPIWWLCTLVCLINQRKKKYHRIKVAWRYDFVSGSDMGFGSPAEREVGSSTDKTVIDGNHFLFFDKERFIT